MLLLLVPASAQFDTPNDTICRNCPFPRVADMDGDGFLDLIFTRPQDPEITWIRNPGNGQFDTTNAAVLALNEHHLTIELVGRIDEDSLLDLAGVTLAPYTDSVVAVLRNLGNGFETVIIDSLVSAMRPLTRMADLNGDGLQDLLGFQHFPDQLGEVWYRNRGDGSFERDTISYWCQPIRGPWAVLDVEGDGDLDLATFDHPNAKRVVVLWNLGAGQFGPPTWATPQYQFTLSARPATDALDVNSDGFVDLVVGGIPCFSEGDGTFLLPSSLWPVPYQSFGNADCGSGMEAFVSGTPGAQGLMKITPSGAPSLPEGQSTAYRSLLIRLDPDIRPDVLIGPTGSNTGTVYWRRNNAFPIGIVYDHPLDTIIAGAIIPVMYPPTESGTGNILADGDWYTGNGVVGDFLYSAGLPEGHVVITAHYMSFNTQTECESTAQDSIYVRHAVGLSDRTKGEFRISPNPVNDELWIHQENAIEYNYGIRDTLGRNVNGTTQKTAWGVSHVNCSGLAQGNYLLVVEDAERPVQVIPFVVVH